MDKRISRKEYMKDYQKLWYLKHKEEIAKKHKEQQPILRLSKQEYRDNHPWLITYDNIYNDAQIQITKVIMYINIGVEI